MRRGSKPKAGAVIAGICFLIAELPMTARRMRISKCHFESSESSFLGYQTAFE
ncbi:hypothetical protein BDV29DRAFT_168424 [Aspergillus leporis]|uniref:Uncharacterized protein n=1 Tax=Aspergillus leporis TaxID=41062 RepID=A0A5N5XDR7_9EURO|nr:hypothetical protein BDV29DRAFT_168424 [Aspergillus leporis]